MFYCEESKLSILFLLPLCYPASLVWPYELIILTVCASAATRLRWPRFVLWDLFYEWASSLFRWLLWLPNAFWWCSNYYVCCFLYVYFLLSSTFSLGVPSLLADYPLNATENLLLFRSNDNAALVFLFCGDWICIYAEWLMELFSCYGRVRPSN